MSDEIPSPSNPTPKIKIPWTKGFELFCRGFNFSEIARELACTGQAVAIAAKRGSWVVKRAKLLDQFPSADPLNNFSPAAMELLNFQTTELERVLYLLNQLRIDFDACDDPSTRVKLANALDTQAERKRLILGIPTPGAKRPVSEKHARRGEVTLISDGPITDVAPLQPGQANPPSDPNAV